MPDSPFTTIGDEPVEARIVAWVLGEASAFEAAELERLCDEKPELMIFKRRMLALHGLLTEAEKPDDSWKLPPEKRKAVEEILGEEPPIRLEVAKEKHIRRSGRRVLLAMAACVLITLFIVHLQPWNQTSEAIIEVKPRQAGKSPLGAEMAETSGASRMTPQFFGTENEKIRSRNNLKKVVDKLDLAKRWDIDQEQAVEKLKDSIKTENVRGTDLIKIQVRQSDKKEADEITREVAYAYKDYREEIEKRDEARQLAELNKAVRDQEDKVEERRKVLATIERTKGQLAANDPREEAIKRGLDAQDYVDAKREFETDQQLLQTMKLKQMGETISRKIPSDSVVIHEIPESKSAEAETQALASNSPVARQFKSTPSKELFEETSQPKNAPNKKAASSGPAGSVTWSLSADNKTSVDAFASAQPPPMPEAAPVLESTAESQALARSGSGSLTLGGGVSGSGSGYGVGGGFGRPMEGYGSSNALAADGSLGDKAPPVELGYYSRTDSDARPDARSNSVLSSTQPMPAAQLALRAELAAADESIREPKENAPVFHGILGDDAMELNGSNAYSGGTALNAGKLGVASSSFRFESGDVAAKDADADSFKKTEAIPATPAAPEAQTPADGPALVAEGNKTDKVEYELHTGYNNEHLFRGIADGKAKDASQKPPNQEFDMTQADGTVKKLTVPRITTRSVLTPDEAIKASKELRETGNADEAKKILEATLSRDTANQKLRDEIAKLDEPVRSNPALTQDRTRSQPPKPDLTKLMEEIPASEEPYSTFSLNISDASFRIAQAALAKGEQPDPAGIKVEQFYNAVDYGDPAPAAGEPVACTIEQAAHPVIPGRNLVRVALKTAAAGRSAAQPLRLTLLVDQSGSMVREDRRAAMDKALGGLAGLLTANDLVTVIGFSRTPRLLADGMSGDQAGKLADLINQTASEGGTNLEEAMKLADQLAIRHKQNGAQNRIVLFTDGAANLGDADPERLAQKVKELRQKGIAFDIAGIAADDLNDTLLGELARNGNGRYYVVGRNGDENFAKQLAGAFRPAAENVKVQVRFNPERVARYKLIGFEKDRLKTEDFRNDKVDAAELAAEEAGVAIYQVEPKAEGNGEIGEVSVRFRDTASGEMVERSWTIPHDSGVPAIDRATPSMQLATLAMLAGEKLKGGPFAAAIDFQQLTAPAANVKQLYGGNGRVGEVLRMVDALK